MDVKYIWTRLFKGLTGASVNIHSWPNYMTYILTYLITLLAPRKQQLIQVLIQCEKGLKLLFSFTKFSVKLATIATFNDTDMFFSGTFSIAFSGCKQQHTFYISFQVGSIHNDLRRGLHLQVSPQPRGLLQRRACDRPDGLHHLMGHILNTKVLFSHFLIFTVVYSIILYDYTAETKAKLETKKDLITKHDGNNWELNSSHGGNSNYLQLPLVLLALQIGILQNELIQNSGENKGKGRVMLNKFKNIMWKWKKV